MKAAAVFLLLTIAYESSGTPEDVIKHSNIVSHNIYKILGRENGNVLFCPVSANIPLSLVYLAAKGKTADELRSGLQLGNNTEDVKTGYRNLIKQLNGETLKLATRLYPRTGFTLNPNFLTTAQQDFDSEIQEIDFSDSGNAAKTINNFVEQKTNNKIHDLIKPGSIDGSTAMVIVNAAYFKDNWKHQFSRTFESDFYTSKNKKVKVQMMMETEFYMFKVSQSLNAKVLQLPFQDESYSMVIVLPNEIEGLPDLEAKLTSFDEELLSDLTYNRVKVQLPKFRIESTLDLKSVLIDMGITTVFSDQSDLSGLAEGQSLAVSDAIQKTFIDVNENGVEAAAATAILVTRQSLLLQQPQEFTADHPFLFAIMHKHTTIFQGRLSII